jgi:hypothetical protein
MTMVSAAFFLYSLPFLEAEPKYECYLTKPGTSAKNATKVWTPCDADVFCEDPKV